MKLLKLFGKKKEKDSAEPSNNGLTIITEKDRDMFRTEEQRDAAWYFNPKNIKPVEIVTKGCFPKKDKYTCDDVIQSWKNGCLAVIMAPVYFILNIGRVISAFIKAIGKFFAFINSCFTERRIPEILIVSGVCFAIIGLLIGFISGLISSKAYKVAEVFAKIALIIILLGLLALVIGIFIKLFRRPKISHASKYISDEEYDELVKKILTIEDVKAKALEAHGLDETEVNEIEPIHFGGPLYIANEKFKIGKDGYLRTNCWQDTWIFFSKTTLFGIQYDLNTDSGNRDVRTYEYQYKDITSIYEDNRTEQVLEKKTKEELKEEKQEEKKGSVSRESGCLRLFMFNPKIPNGCKKDAELSGCLAEGWEPGCFENVADKPDTKPKKENNKFKLVTKRDSKLRIVVPGDVFEISYKNNNDENNSIKAMKAMLREKKNN